MLAMFHELEDQNLSLIQNGQDMEENIDEIKSQANVSPAFWPIFEARLKMIIGGDTEQSSILFIVITDVLNWGEW